VKVVPRAWRFKKLTRHMESKLVISLEHQASVSIVTHVDDRPWFYRHHTSSMTACQQHRGTQETLHF
jgi:hypothetical protein